METEVIRLAANPEEAQRLQWGTWTASAALLLVLLLTMVLGITCGAVPVPLPSIAAWLTHTRPLSEGQRVFLMEIRLPRIIAAAMVGAALSAAGLMFQGLFRNPLADPYVIGSSGGAVLGATVGMVLLPQVTWLGFSANALLAFAGSVATIAVVYCLARVAARHKWLRCCWPVCGQHNVELFVLLR